MSEPLCEALEWDSAFFGISIARCNATQVNPARRAAILEWCTTHRIDCLYCLVAADDPETVHALEDAKFRFMDVRVTLTRTLPSPSAGGANGTRHATHADIDALRTIARTAHRDTRFYADPNFNPDRCDELYATWIARSCQGYANRVIVVDRDSVPVGYVSLHIDESDARIGLLGVHAEWRRQGVGRELLNAAFFSLAGEGVTQLSVVTPGRNIAAQALYQDAGFRTAHTALWYHRWFKPGRRSLGGGGR